MYVVEMARVRADRWESGKALSSSLNNVDSNPVSLSLSMFLPPA